LAASEHSSIDLRRPVDRHHLFVFFVGGFGGGGGGGGFGGGGGGGGGGLDGLTVFFDVFEVLGGFFDVFAVLLFGLFCARITGNSFGKPAMIEKPATIAVSFMNFRRPRLRITYSDVGLLSYGATLRYCARCW
jgi:hypothetical protein